MADASPVRFAPAGTAELLDRTFTLYRRRFLFVVPLAALAAAADHGLTIAALTMLEPLRPTIAGAPTGDEIGHWKRAYWLYSSASSIAGLAATILAFDLLLAVVGRDVWRIETGETAEAASAIRYLRARVWRVAGAGLLHTSLVVVGLTAFVLPGLLLFVRLCLMAPATMIEGLGPRAAVRRSWDLTGSGWIRVVAIAALGLAVLFCAGTILAPPLVIVESTSGFPADHPILWKGLDITAEILAEGLAWPIGALALSLLYIDERIRREGLDLRLMMGRLPLAATDAPGAVV